MRPQPDAPPLRAASTDGGYRAWRRRRFFGGLDGLRGLAILAVVWHHAGGESLASVGLARGFLGVDLFFTLSGFLIVTLLLRERSRSGRICLSSFYARRSLRILPLYYALLLGVTGVYVLLKPADPRTEGYVEGFGWAALFLSNLVLLREGVLAVTWSLATEEQFYLAWAPVERFFSRWVAYTLTAAVAAASLALSFGVFDRWLLDPTDGPGGLAGRPLLPLLGTTLFPIAVGVALAHTLHRPRGYAALARVVARPLAAPAFAAAGVALLFLMPGDLRGWPRPVLQLCGVGLLAAVLVGPGSATARWLAWPPLARLGMVSYGVYLLHKPVMVPVERLVDWAELPGRVGGPAGVLVLTAAVLAATWTAAELSFRFFETPFLRLKSRFARTRAGAADPR